MNNLQEHGTPPTDIESLARSRQNLEYIRQELIEYRPDITDSELRAKVTRFLADATDLPPASAREYIASELHEIRSHNPMYRETGMTDPTEAFPDSCKGCDHYGVRCPVLTQTAEIDRRERIFRETDDPKELRRKLREYAIDNDCHVIKNALDEIEQDHEPLVAEGMVLLMLVEETLHFGDHDESVIRMLSNRLQHIRRQRLDEDLEDQTEPEGPEPDAGAADADTVEAVADGGGEDAEVNDG